MTKHGLFLCMGRSVLRERKKYRDCPWGAACYALLPHGDMALHRDARMRSWPRGRWREPCMREDTGRSAADAARGCGRRGKEKRRPAGERQGAAEGRKKAHAPMCPEKRAPEGFFRAGRWSCLPHPGRKGPCAVRQKVRTEGRVRVALFRGRRRRQHSLRASPVFRPCRGISRGSRRS